MAGVNTNKPPGEADWEEFNKRTSQEKAKILYLYLYCKLNMGQVAMEVFGSDVSWDSFMVSAVTKYYGFSGQNSGYFSKKLAYNLDYNDFFDFVRMYPGGTRGDWPNHNTIDEFMRGRHNQKLNPYGQPYITQYPTGNMPADNYYQQNAWNSPANNDNQRTDWKSTWDQIGENNRKQLAEKTNKILNGENDKQDETEGLIISIIIAIFFIVILIKYIVDHASFASFFASVAGVLGVAGFICFYGAIILFFIALVTSKVRKLLKVILPMAAIGFLLVSLADGDFGAALISALVAYIGYIIGDALYKK